MAAEQLKHYIVLDVETSRSGFLIQVAYAMYDREFNQVKAVDVLVNECSNKTDFYKKFSLEQIIMEGLSPYDVLSELSSDFAECGHIVCHNAAFDTRILRTYFEKYNVAHTMPDIICTMKLSKSFCGLKDVRNRPKNPKLSELYAICCGEDADSEQQHSADYDIHITFKCFKHLCEKKVINP